MKIRAFVRLLIRKINSLERKTHQEVYLDNPFYRPYSNTFVWVEENKRRLD